MCVYIYIFFFRFFSPIGYYKILSIIPLFASLNPFWDCTILSQCFSFQRSSESGPQCSFPAPCPINPKSTYLN